MESYKGFRSCLLAGLGIVASITPSCGRNEVEYKVEELISIYAGKNNVLEASEKARLVRDLGMKRAVSEFTPLCYRVKGSEVEFVDDSDKNFTSYARYLGMVKESRIDSLLEQLKKETQR